MAASANSTRQFLLQLENLHLVRHNARRVVTKVSVRIIGRQTGKLFLIHRVPQKWPLLTTACYSYLERLRHRTNDGDTLDIQ